MVDQFDVSDHLCPEHRCDGVHGRKEREMHHVDVDTGVSLICPHALDDPGALCVHSAKYCVNT